MGKLTPQEIEEILDLFFPEGGAQIPEFAEITAEELLQAFKEDPRVVSAEYENGTFHLETTAGPIKFGFKSIRSDA